MATPGHRGGTNPFHWTLVKSTREWSSKPLVFQSESGFNDSKEKMID